MERSESLCRQDIHTRGQLFENYEADRLGWIMEELGSHPDVGQYKLPTAAGVVTLAWMENMKLKNTWGKSSFSLRIATVAVVKQCHWRRWTSNGDRGWRRAVACPSNKRYRRLTHYWLGNNYFLTFSIMNEAKAYREIQFQSIWI